MEEQETATKVADEKIEKSTEETIKDKSPTTPSPNSGTWWGSWISQAKEKSASVLEAVKNDLNEITTAVTETLNLAPTDEELVEEASQQPDNISDAGSVNFTQVKQSISSSISQFFGTVTDALIPQLDEDDTSEAMLISNDETIVLSGFAKHLKELQENDETYLEEPSKTAEHAEKYRMWLEIVEQDQFTQPKIEKMLQQSHVLNEKYNKFVPDTVSHMNFFKRYLFKKALLEDELASEERRKKEAEIIRTQPEPAVVEPIVEEKEVQKTVVDVKKEKPSGDLEIADFELSEEEQARLLEAYEQEIKEREKKEGPEESPKVTKPQKSAKKTTNVQSKSNTAASSATSKGKNNKDLKNQQQPQKSTQQQKAAKNQLKPALKEPNKDQESSTSDESWEKDFDM